MNPSPTRRTYESDLADVFCEALRDGLTVELQQTGDGNLVFAVDGVEFAEGFPLQSFAYPLSDCGLGDEATALADDLVRKMDSRRYARRAAVMATDTHLACHGGQLPGGDD